MSTSKLESNIKRNEYQLEQYNSRKKTEIKKKDPGVIQRLNVAVRIRPILPKDFDKEVIIHAESAPKPNGEQQKDDSLGNELNMVRLTDMTHHMKSRYQRVFP